MSAAGVCGACARPICDRFLLRVNEVSYHEKCLSCSACGAPLQHTCYVRHTKLYCRPDYDRLYAKKCLGCGECVSSEELVMRVSTEVFHVRCFVCVVCGGRLQTGDHYVLKQGQLFCTPDYDKEVDMFHGYSSGEMMCEELSSSRRSDGRRGPKRPRTILTTQQRRAFKASFEISPKPCRKIREGLAKDTGLSVRIVQVWFQNQRAKVKKFQKKARDKSAAESNKEGAETSVDSKLNIKEENPSPHGLGMFLNDSCSDNDIADNVAEASQRHFLPIKEEQNSQEEFYKNTAIQNAFAGFASQCMPGGEKLGAALLNFPYSCEQQQQALSHFLGAAPPFAYAPKTSLNPIDRLYSMQTSYFCADEDQ